MGKNNQGSLDKLLQEISPEEQAKTDAKMQLAAKIADAMETKGWNNKMLMKAMGKKNPSEITRWLSGTHNFTVDTLIDLERVLETKLLNLTDEDQAVQQSPGTHKNRSQSIISNQQSEQEPGARNQEPGTRNQEPRTSKP